MKLIAKCLLTIYFMMITYNEKVVNGQTLIPGEPKDLDGIVGIDGNPIIDSGTNKARMLGPRCEWNTLHGANPNIGMEVAKWSELIKDKPFFIKECGACLARANQGSGCPSPSLAWAYDCKANDLYTLGFCLREQSAYFLFVVYIFPISTLLFILFWLSCIKIRICPCNQFINWYRKSNKRTKTSSFGVA